MVHGATAFRGQGHTAPSAIVLSDTAGNQWYLWVDTAGTLRSGDADTVEAAGFNFLTGGTAVGAQTLLAARAEEKPGPQPPVKPTHPIVEPPKPTHPIVDEKPRVTIRDRIRGKE
jgi:hypothetical protein